MSGVGHERIDVPIVVDWQQMIGLNVRLTASDGSGVPDASSVITFDGDHTQFARLGEVYGEFKDNPDTTLASLLLDRARGERDPLIRDVLYAHRLRIERARPTRPDTAVLREALSILLPASHAWSICPDILVLALQAGGSSGSVFGGGHARYLAAATASHPDPMVQAELQRFVERARAQQAAARDAERPKGTPEALKRGDPLPEFSVPALDIPDARYTNADYVGKTFLLDFWATWCRPCVGEMPMLHQAYREYGGDHFEILSISMDRSVDYVTRFRAGNWPMPWNHSFVNGALRASIAARFGVKSIPKPILVDENGTILAIGRELRGKNLIKALENVLGADR